MDENDECDENLDILEDIKALEQALLQGDTSDNEEQKKNESAEINISHHEDSKELLCLRSNEKLSESEVPEEDEYSDVNDVVIAAYQHNLKLISLLKSAAADISAQLEACLKRQQEVDYQIQLISKGGRANWKIHYKKAGMPYFKDKQSFSAPINEDTKKKQENGELSIPRFRRPTRWTTKDRNTLKIAVRAQAANETFERMIKESVASSQANGQETECVPPKDLLAMVGPLGAKEFDWMRISNIDLKGRHSPHECRVIWNILLHPEINSQKWTNDEDMYLKMISKAHKYENWDMIAKKLGTNRSPYICFIRFNTLFGTAATEALWTPAENEFLLKCIEKLRFGNYLPWGQISMYITNRTKNQVYSRWKYNLDPSVKKGRFTGDEDELLLDSVAKMGTNFPKIAAEVMPNRTSVQLSTRFRLLMLKTNESYNSWTITEDRKLLQLYDEFGTQWSMIANIMKKDRTYIRHRYTIIRRHLMKGIDLTRIPRKSVYDKIIAQRIEEGNSITNEYEIRDCYDREVGNLIKKQCINESDLSADAQLIRYFQSIQAPAVKPGRKATYHTADELEINTNKLYRVFDKLDAKFDIPDDLNSYNITVKDKELLQSLKKVYANKEIMSAKTIERYRQRMFGDSYLNENEERFIPPAPFGLFQRFQNKRRTNKINIINNNNCDLELDFIFGLQTPKNIKKIFTHEENKNFDKMSSLISKKCRVLGFPGRFEQAYISPENVDDIYVEKLRLLDKKTIDNFESYDAELLKMRLINNHIFLPPSHSTLLGYQNLLIMKEAVNNAKIVDDEVTLTEMNLTHRGRRAFSLFKIRLFRLLKYPIVMAKISPSCNIKRIPLSNLLPSRRGIDNKGTCSKYDESMEIDDPDDENLNDDENMQTDDHENTQDTSSEEILPEMMCDVKCRVSFDE